MPLVAGSIPGPGTCYIRCKNLALNIRDCVDLCLSEETLKTVGTFYLVAMPGELKGHCIEFKYYMPTVYILVLPRQVNNS